MLSVLLSLSLALLFLLQFAAASIIITSVSCATINPVFHIASAVDPIVYSTIIYITIVHPIIVHANTNIINSDSLFPKHSCSSSLLSPSYTFSCGDTMSISITASSRIISPISFHKNFL